MSGASVLTLHHSRFRVHTRSDAYYVQTLSDVDMGSSDEVVSACHLALAYDHPLALQAMHPWLMVRPL